MPKMNGGILFNWGYESQSSSGLHKYGTLQGAKKKKKKKKKKNIPVGSKRGAVPGFKKVKKFLSGVRGGGGGLNNSRVELVWVTKNSPRPDPTKVKKRGGKKGETAKKKRRATASSLQ